MKNNSSARFSASLSDAKHSPRPKKPLVNAAEALHHSINRDQCDYSNASVSGSYRADRESSIHAEMNCAQIGRARLR